MKVRVVRTAMHPLDSSLLAQIFAMSIAYVITLAFTLAMGAMLLKGLQILYRKQEILYRKQELLLPIVKQRLQGFRCLLLSLLFTV